ncbi:hypothetical protein HIM_01184 [Hirsutella minnesotensis 3608]|nr:hypothetical protein HIM_01184 [Hirsutella minnesotensis 3608]
MSAPFPNHYTHRRVAEASAKACDVCYKPSTSVLITPDKKDFFYICPIHLKDRYFCTPKIDQDAVKAKREKEMAEEMERVKKEYEEKQRKKKDDEPKDKNESKDKSVSKAKDEKAEDEDSQKKDKPEDRDDEKKDDSESAKEDDPRVFELKSAFYQQRLQRKRQAEAAKRDRERASQPNYFPSVPSDLPRK